MTKRQKRKRAKRERHELPPVIRDVPVVEQKSLIRRLLSGVSARSW